MNLGHVYLIQKEEKKAIECYVESYNNFISKRQYWEGMKDDLYYLNYNGISSEYYETVLERLSNVLNSQTIIPK